MKFSELSNKSVAELQKDLSVLRDEASSLKVKSRLAQVKNTHSIKAVRKDVARILTALKAKN